MNIDVWLSKFKENWVNHNVHGVLALFHKEVIYFETPFYKLDNLVHLKKEWEAIKNQNNIIINYEVFNKDGNKYSVNWNLTYISSHKKRTCAGVYHIKLDANNLCTYFYQSCECLP